MKTLHPDLTSHLQSEATTVCMAWIVARRDGTRLGFTDHDRPLEVDGIVCAPATGFTAGAAEASLGMSGDISDIAGALSSEAITDADIERGQFDGAEVLLFLVNWSDPNSASLLRRFHIGEITRAGASFRAELRSLSATLDQPRGRYFTRGCDAELGDTRCGFDLDTPGYSGTGALTAIIDQNTVQLSGVGNFEPRWFDLGTLRFDDGPRAGDRLAISTAAPSGAMTRVVFQVPLGAPANPGDAVTLFAGCDKAFGTCRTKFANQLNFQGCPHIPGDDQALNYARENSVFDGGPIVP